VIDGVEGQTERFWSEAVGEVDLSEEINGTGSHVSSNFGLLVHGLSRTRGVSLKARELAVLSEGRVGCVKPPSQARTAESLLGILLLGR